MPFKSEKQRRYMYAKHPKIAKRWASKYGNRPHNRDVIDDEDLKRGYQRPGNPPVHRINNPQEA